MSNDLKNAAVYARVSSEKQAEKDLSIPAQLKALKKYALHRGWDIVAEYVDEAESARSANRPAFQKMITAAKKKERPFDIILVWKLSRFARNREDSIIYKSLLRRRGISVVSINEQIDDSASGRLLEGMIEVIDEFYSANLAQDTMRGMKENINRGYFNGGKVPYGYRKVKVPDGASMKTKLEPDEAEAPIIKQAFRLALEGKGAKGIAHNLNTGGFRTRVGKLLSTTVINFWLRNPVYKGTLAWNRNDKTGSKALRKPAAELILVPNAHQALVSEDDFERVQALLTDRRPVVRHPRVVASPYLLSGFCFCGKCGAALIGTAAKSGKYQYYECNSHFKIGNDSCSGIRLGKGKFESFIISRLRNNVLTEDHLVELVHLINADLIETTSRHEKELEQTELQLFQVSNKLTKLYQALETGKLEIDDLAPRIKEMRSNQQNLQRQRDLLIQKIETDEPEELDPEVVVRYANEIKRVFEESELLQQKSFLRTFLKRVEVDPEKVVIDYTIPLPVEKGRTSAREVLYINQTGSAYGIRTRGFCLERAAS